MSENPVTFYVKATVTAQIKAYTRDDALQELCNRIGQGAFEVNMVDAERVPIPAPTAESEAAVDELVRLANESERIMADLATALDGGLTPPAGSDSDG